MDGLCSGLRGVPPVSMAVEFNEMFDMLTSNPILQGRIWARRSGGRARDANRDHRPRRPVRGSNDWYSIARLRWLVALRATVACEQEIGA